MKKLLLALTISFNCSAQQIEIDTVIQQINLNLAEYKSQQMTGLSLQLIAAAMFYGIATQDYNQQQHDICFVMASGFAYAGTIIRINAFDKLYFKRKVFR